MSHQFQEYSGSTYVQTSASEHVFHHLEMPRCNHLLIHGVPGTGKTRLLHHLSVRFQSAGHLVVSLPLRTSRSLEELVTQLIARLIDSLPPASSSALERLRTAYNTVSLADASTAMTRVLESVSQELASGQRIFILLDGLDEVMPNGEELFGQRVLEWLAAVPTEHGSIVLTSRPMAFFQRSPLESRRLATFTLDGWTVREVADLVGRRLRSQNLELPQRLIDDVIIASSGVPALAVRILEHAARTGQLTQPDAINAAQGAAAAAASYSLASFESDWDNRDEFWSILLASWAARRIHPHELEGATGVPQTRIATWITEAEARAFIERDGNSVVMHEVLDSVIMRELLPNGIDLDRLVFGDEAAERDKLLATIFDEPADIPEILDGSKTIVLGDRGAGKSAIYRSLIERGGSSQTNGTIVAAAKNPADFLVKMGSANNPTAERFKAIWLLYVASLASRELQSRVDTSTERGKRYRDDCHRLLRSLGQEDDIKAPSLRSRLVSPLRALLPEKVSFTVGPVQIEQEFNSAAKSNSNTVDINDFLQRTEAILEGANLRLVVVFDQIDEAHKYQKSQEQLVQGLLMAESKLAHTQSIRLVVLLRTDLYEIYHIEEKNKFISRTARLTWTGRQLAQQLLRRTYSNAQLKHVAERLDRMAIDQKSRELIQMRLLFPAVIERKEFWHWLMDGLTTGNKRVAPRQIVLFMNLLKEEAKGSGVAQRIPVYSESQVLAAVKELSRLSYNEVIDDFKVATVLVQNCKAHNLHRIRFADVEKLSDPGQGTPAAQVDQLRRLGFFEHAVGQQDGEVVSELQVAALYRRFWI